MPLLQDTTPYTEKPVAPGATVGGSSWTKDWLKFDNRCRGLWGRGVVWTCVLCFTSEWRWAETQMAELMLRPYSRAFKVRLGSQLPAPPLTTRMPSRRPAAWSRYNMMPTPGGIALPVPACCCCALLLCSSALVDDLQVIN